MANSKLEIINTCLLFTGNAIVNVEEDGSDEWMVGSAAYEAAVSYLLASHDWKFETQIATLNRIGDSDDDNYEDIYRKPQNCLGLVWVKQSDQSVDWKIIGNNIYTTRGSGSAPTAKYVLRGDPSAWNEMFIQAVRALTMAGIYSGLNEDVSSANGQERKAQDYLAQARTRTDREDKPRPVYRSRILARRLGATPRTR